MPSVRRFLPGLFRLSSKDRTTRLEEIARNAAYAMFPSQGGSSFMPRIDLGTGNVAASSGGATYADPLGAGSASAEASMNSNPLLFGPVWRVAFRIGGLPLKIYEFVGDEEEGAKQRQEAPDHPAYALLRNPNPDMPGNLLISGTVENMYINSACAWLKERKAPGGPSDPSNPVVALWPIPSDSLFVKRHETRLIGEFEIRVQGQPPKPVPRSDICYFRLMPKASDWVNSTSPVTTLGDTLGFSEDAIAAMRDMFRTAFLQRLWIDLHGADLDDTALTRLAANMELARRSRWGVPIMESGATIEGMGTYGSSVEDQVLKSALDLAREIVEGTFGLPEKRDDLATFYGEVIQPVADAIERELERSLMTEWPDRPAFPEFQFREILAGSPLDRAKLHQTKILSAQETPNEARRAENLPPIEGGDASFLPLNVGTVYDAMTPGSLQVQEQVSIPKRYGPGDMKKTSLNQEEKDSTGGLGGSEGKDAEGNPIVPKTPMSRTAARAGAEQRVRGWLTLRERILRRQGQAIERRLRGIINDERDELLAGDDPESVFAASDTRIANLLEAFCIQVAEAAAEEAGTYALSDEMRPSLPESAENYIRTRAQEMAAQFGARRRQASREGDLKETWKSLATHLTGTLATNEALWAFERAAASVWGEELVMVRTGSDRCEVCERASSQPFAPDSVPTPLHPNCRCGVFPARLVYPSAEEA